jgi:hypothetical protein
MATSNDKYSTEIDTYFDQESTEGRLDTALAEALEPVTARELAAAVGHDPAAVRGLLRSFVELGLAIERAGEPPTYERNHSAFEWSRVEELADDHSIAALDARIVALCERLDTDGSQRTKTRSTTADGRPVDNRRVKAHSTREQNVQTKQRQLQRYERARQIRLTRDDSAATDAGAESTSR